MPLNIPILLTWLRVVLIPVFVVVFYLPSSWISPTCANWLGALIFAFASITDWLDGYLARRWEQTSSFGAFLDPVADKLIVAVALILLVGFDRTSMIWAMIIIGREITISALREWMAQMGKRKNVAVAYIGKLKTTAQMVAIVLLLINSENFMGLNLQVIGNILMIVAAVLTIWSMFYYLKIAKENFTSETDK
ncbi:CDP-diacylglycerol--glycerol-3-phosphate 3-phosphatidyltransferase [Neisseria sp. Ec49-e6-T10]|uniref:CDP-diacylglycerol--glycerol-3-phosphate 3-phosphatidyltransferase n=1 Tax=Neisseria sp. Ec49-e6-T10 TaxID=3140744 RepID=UPI003EBF2E7E